MKRILLAFLLFLAIPCFPQCADEAVSEDEDQLSYLLHMFLNMDLVIGPDIYNPSNDPGLEYVIFSQDTIFSLKDPNELVHAAIDKMESKNALYCIGSVANYRIDDWVVGITMVKGFADGRQEEIFLPLHFNEIPISYDLDYEYALYGVNVELHWAYGDGVLD